MKQAERKGGRGGLCRPMGEHHGMSRTKIYKCWTDMVSRCVKANTKAYQRYGAKGIKMYQPWADNFMEFYKWAMDNGFNEGDSVLRKDLSGNYEPSNCYIKSLGELKRPKSNNSQAINKDYSKSNRVIERTHKHSVKTTQPGRHPLYTVWQGIKTRCYNPNSSHYQWYGAKGVTVCDEWLNDFQAFYDWAIANGWEKGLTIDRKDNDKSYSPDNCQFLTKSQNSIKRNYQLFFNLDGTIKKALQ